MTRQRYVNTGKTKRSKESLLQRLMEMCAEQGVKPQDTLTEADIKKFMVLTHAEKNMINLISTGFPVRNAATILRAIDMKLDRSAPKATPASDNQGVSVTINTITKHNPTVSTTFTPPAKDDGLPPEPQDLAEDEEKH